MKNFSGIKKIFEYNGKFRIKLTDKCNLKCPFCHWEGTKNTEKISAKDVKLLKWLKKLNGYYNKVHLTGGEPTLFKGLPKFCKLLKSYGYEVYLTTNGTILNRNLIDSLPYLSSINVSFHTLNNNYFKDFLFQQKSTDKIVENIKNNIIFLKNNSKKVAINTVVSPLKEQGLSKILDFASENGIYLKLVPDWRSYKDSLKFIGDFLADKNFKLDSVIFKVPGSNMRKIFINQSGQTIELKDIIPYYPDFWCNGCNVKGKCIETFAFLRLEGNPIRFKLCIDRPTLSSSDFEKTTWDKLREILISTKKNLA